MKIKTKFAILAMALFAVGAVFAQVETGAPVAEAATQAKVKEISAIEFLLKGGVFLIPIALLLFYTISIGIEKFLYIRRVTRFDASLLNDMRNSLTQGNVENALSTVSRDKTAYGVVIKEGVQTIGRPVSEIESNMDKVTNIEIGKMEKNLGHLGMVASIAPTLGFVGTISGVIKIFYSISITENVSIGNISAGLYEKMIASGAGLTVGIVAFAIYHILNGLIDKYALNIQKVNMDFVNIIQRPNHGDKTK
jgi:biopolymer transport protein ExbB